MTYEDLFLEGYYDALNELQESEDYDEYEEAYMEGYYAALNETSKATKEKQVAAGLKMPRSKFKISGDAVDKLKKKRQEDMNYFKNTDRKLKNGATVHSIVSSKNTKDGSKVLSYNNYFSKNNPYNSYEVTDTVSKATSKHPHKTRYFGYL
jgi:hypothetical protein